MSLSAKDLYFENSATDNKILESQIKAKILPVCRSPVMVVVVAAPRHHDSVYVLGDGVGGQ
jgi:hypothetical protein